MNTEWQAEIERRATLHAVLSDPGRLAVVELLSLGDHSPSELSAELGMASNLVAHHVGVLVDHGLVSRRRSEGDRRRTYLHLTANAAMVPSGWTMPRPRRVLFVCTANSARSHLAAALWHRASPITATSAGTHPATAVAAGALAAAARHDLPLPNVKPRPFNDVRRDDDLVVTVCDNAHEEMGTVADVHWSVPDPVPAADDAAFDAAFEEIARRVEDLAPRIAHA
ncbi:arsenate reductase/protein-tyrosine-phosphatase family protein [Cellulomonas xylanilytica]|uniref:Putative regulatory protein, ArsR family n=1 Tax=Cellulomonas xylanilytica TaxID=233583 RepID=A0A510V470_9CELL|nr:MarR family transcriptional regulator [Cellulomonas xylanilytica]GEK19915.1 putative regulatory protein, ArsR family [Cellulomonas xylanilytica]